MHFIPKATSGLDRWTKALCNEFARRRFDARCG
jgi:hypothetical protein